MPKSAWGLPSWYVRAYSGLVILVFCLIALGGSVRIMKAGLACPDWPLCFGRFIPDYHPQVYFEFIHRVVAGTVSLLTLGLQIVLWRSRAPRGLKIAAVASLVILTAQIVYGGLTVLLLLTAHVVATHLLLGTGFFATLLWIYLGLRPVQVEPPVSPRWLRVQSMLLCTAIYGQLLLGGLVASNFASLVCIDFPTCHGEWFPTFSGIIGLHVWHRLGAYSIFVLSLANWWAVARLSGRADVQRLAGLLFLCVCGQVALGISNVLLLTPPVIAVAHLALGVGVLSVAIRQLHLTMRGHFSRRPIFENPVAVQGGPFERLQV